ncbi:hypothetical protein HED10_12310 [Escherichia coli]|uniref:hypothetical protein n=1 Tax=Escherichia coli TaxID=562 RepID=UPI001C452B76|nr:hypothetical protein [Escherichia coli]MBV7160250.1 hypothetical protein [Escherichia coli]
MKVIIGYKKQNNQLDVVVSAWCWEMEQLNKLTKEVIRVFFVEGEATCVPSSFLLRRKYKVSGPESSKSSTR